MTLLVLTIFAALVFDFVNGWNDSANAIATIIGSRALKPWKAVLLAAATNFVGAFWSIKIAETISKIVVDTPMTHDYMTVIALAGLLSAILWASFMTIIGMPISGSHSLVGGVTGAAFVAGGLGAIKYSAISKVIIGLLVSPFLGFVLGFIVFLIIAWSFRNFKMSTMYKIFSPLQILSASWMGFAHGTNDAQKVMGIIYMCLIGAGFLAPHSEMPLWVIISCATAISLGTWFGGWKVIKTMGSDLSDLRTPEGFAAEASAAGILMGAAELGMPVSTTHVITSSILGVASTKPNPKWALGRKIVTAWVLTLPVTAVISGILFLLLRMFV